MPTWSQTQGNNYSGIVEIATLGFADVNAMVAAQSGFYAIANGIPANVIVIGIYAKTVTAFTSVTRTIKSIGVSLDTGTFPPLSPISGFSVNETALITAGNKSFLPPDQLQQWQTSAQNIYLDLDWVADNNPRDYTTGELKIYIETRAFPTI